MFWGKSFSFNGIPCEDFDLMLYHIGGNSHSAGKFASGVSIVEERLPSRWKPIFYGTKNDNKLEFTIVFGANPERATAKKSLDRYELEAIANWLTGHNEYLWLGIEQDDLEYARYRCIITNLEMIEYGMMPWALKANVVCDGPYAYLYPQTYEYEITDKATLHFFNESGHVGYYMPILEIVGCSSDFRIINHSDNNREFVISGLVGAPKDFYVDNDLGIMTCSDSLINPYEHFNFNFFRLVNGDNYLEIKGNCTLRITCEFPVNVGG